MSYKIEVFGLSVSVDTVEEALALINKLKGDQGSTKHKRPTTKDQALKLLSIVSAEGPKGMPSSEIAARLGSPGARALGGLSVSAKKIIAAKAGGKPVDDYFWKSKQAGVFRWFADAKKLKEIGIEV